MSFPVQCFYQLLQQQQRLWKKNSKYKPQASAPMKYKLPSQISIRSFRLFQYHSECLTNKRLTTAATPLICLVLQHFSIDQSSTLTKSCYFNYNNRNHGIWWFKTYRFYEPVKTGLSHPDCGGQTVYVTSSQSLHHNQFHTIVKRLKIFYIHTAPSSVYLWLTQASLLSFTVCRNTFNFNSATAVMVAAQRSESST